jgi:hypothetical protein
MESSTAEFLIAVDAFARTPTLCVPEHQHCVYLAGCGTALSVVMNQKIKLMMGCFIFEIK